MDLIDALKTWDNMGLTTEDYYDDNQNYIIDFLDSDGKKAGYIKTVSGGILYNLPTALFN